jgi:ribonuclease HI
MSSARGELHGQTAMAIISDILLEAHNAPTTKITLHGDNKGVQHTCTHIKTNRLKHHRQSNMDLKIEYNNASRGHHITNEWVPGHQDGDKQWNTISDLKDMKLNNLAIFNIWCDKKGQ